MALVIQVLDCDMHTNVVGLSHQRQLYHIDFLFQGFLLQHNENEALSPGKLQEKITDMLRSNPDMAEAVSFFSYRSNLKLSTNKNKIFISIRQ